jgi:hypothetical protein
MMLYAKSMKFGKCGQSFKLSGGQGSLQLKCEHDLSGSVQNQVSLRFSIGNAQESRIVEHDFSRSAACASPDWDFSKAVSKNSQTLLVSVEVLTV